MPRLSQCHDPDLGWLHGVLESNTPYMYTYTLYFIALPLIYTHTRYKKQANDTIVGQVNVHTHMLM